MRFTHVAAALAVADAGQAFVLPFKLPTLPVPTLALPTLPPLQLPPFNYYPPGPQKPTTTSTSSNKGVTPGTKPPVTISSSASSNKAVTPGTKAPVTVSTSSSSNKAVTPGTKPPVTVNSSASTSSNKLVTPGGKPPVTPNSSASKAGTVTIATPAPAPGSLSTKASGLIGISTSASRAASSGGTLSSKSVSRTGTTPLPLPLSTKSALCTVVLTRTVSTTVTPIATLPTYVSYVLINGDDFVGSKYTPDFQTITNDYTTFISSTLTITSTSVPQQFIGYTQTTTELPPSGFRPVRDTLPSAGFDGQFGGPNPFNPDRRLMVRDAVTSTCSIVSTTTTITSTLPTRVVFTTITSRVVAYAFPIEGFTAFGDQYSTTPFTVTKVVGTPTTIYEATTTTTTTLTAPTATQTLYAACADNNFADYVEADGARYNLTTLSVNGGQIDTSFDSAPSADNIDTAYKCCAYAIGRKAASWLYVGGDTCFVLFPSFSGSEGQCPGQQDASTQFEANYGTEPYRRVAGNGYCGQISSVYNRGGN